MQTCEAGAVRILVVLMMPFAFLFLFVFQVYGKEPSGSGEAIKVFVSILPQAYFVERVGGDRVDVSVMVGPGQSPATYEPSPRQMAELGKAKLYFRVGVPFESVWIDRIGKANAAMTVVDTRHGIELMPLKARRQEMKEGARHHVRGMRDPHIWLSLRLVKVQVKNVYEALVSVDPAHKDMYRENQEGFCRDLDRLDAQISNALKGATNSRFMVFHPAWGYFAQDYELEQIPIEIEGKQPSAKALSHLIEEAKKEGIKVIFVQKQFSKHIAESVARAIGGEVVHIDPLARDYLDNMSRIAQTFARVLQ